MLALERLAAAQQVEADSARERVTTPHTARAHADARAEAQALSPASPSGAYAKLMQLIVTKHLLPHEQQRHARELVLNDAVLEPAHKQALLVTIDSAPMPLVPHDRARVHVRAETNHARARALGALRALGILKRVPRRMLVLVLVLAAALLWRACRTHALAALLRIRAALRAVGLLAAHTLAIGFTVTPNAPLA